MEKKYELTSKTLKYYSHTLHRIKALKDFGNVRRGDLGGWIECEENLSQEGDCWIYDSAVVYDNAKISGNAKVYDNAVIFGDVVVYDNAKVYGKAVVCDRARVYGEAVVCDCAWVYGEARVMDRARVFGEAGVYGSAKVCEMAKVYGKVEVGGLVYGSAVVCNDSIDKTIIKFKYFSVLWFLKGEV